MPPRSGRFPWHGTCSRVQRTGAKMRRKVHLVAIATWGVIGCCGPAHALLYSSMDLEISIRKEYVQTDASAPVPNLPAPWCVSIGTRQSDRAIDALVTPPDGSTLPAGTISLGETVCFDTLPELTAAMPVGIYTLTASMGAASPSDPPILVNAMFQIDYPFPMTNEVPVVENRSWDDPVFHAHKKVPLQLSNMVDPYAISFPWYRTAVDTPDGASWFCATSGGSPYGNLTYVGVPNPYRVSFSFLDEVYAVSAPYRIAVTYEVRTILDMVLLPDPEVRMTVAANAIQLVGSELLPQREYDIERAENLSASSSWVPVASFAATATTHTVSGFTPSGEGYCYRLRLVPN